MNEKINTLISPSSSKESFSFNELDPYKLLKVLRKSIWWMIGLFVIFILIAFVYLRYTKPVFQSRSTLKLNITRQADFFGFAKSSQKEEANNLSGEIELIRSSMLLGMVIDNLNLYVSYYMCGKILDSELYRTSPLEVDYKILNESFYDKRFYVNMLDDKNFELTYSIGNQKYKETSSFGKIITNPNFTMVIRPTIYFSSYENVPCLYFIINSRSALLNYLSSNMGADVLNTYANTILISFKDHHNIKAKHIVAEIDSTYLELTLQEKTKANKQKINFLEHQLKETEQRLEEYERYFEDFTIENKTSDIPADMVKTVVEIKELQKEKKDLLIQITLTNKIQEQLLQGSDSIIVLTITDKMKDQKLAQLVEELNKLQEDKRRVSASYKETSFAFKSKEYRLDYIKSEVIKKLDENKVFLYDELKEYSTKINELENKFVSLPFKNTQYAKNKRYYDLYENFYLSMMQKKAEYKIEEAGTVPEFVVLSPAGISTVPVFPQKIVVYGISIGISIFLTLCLIVIMYLSYNTIDNLRELERYTTVPVLGVIPTYHKEEMDFSKLVIDKNPKSAISEAFRTIRTNLDFLISSDKKKKVISITSTVSGEGKTFVAVNLAGIISLSQQKVIVLDLDMRKPKIHLAFDTEENTQGMSTILINKHHWKDCVKKTTLPNLDYLSAGPTPPNPSELIIGNRLLEIIKELQEVYDIVVLDTPPVGLVTDGILVMKQVDIPLYIVRAEYSKKDFITGLNKLYADSKFAKLAIILNAVKQTRINYGYGYNYAGYYEEEKQLSTLGKLKKKWFS